MTTVSEAVTAVWNMDIFTLLIIIIAIILVFGIIAVIKMQWDLERDLATADGTLKIYK